jgi:membrane protease YdiL (CAAX protease family)
MNRLKRLFRETFPDLEAHPVGLTVLSLAMLTLYVRMGSRRFAPQWWLDNMKEWTGLGDLQLFRYWWKETACFVLLMVIPMAFMRIFAGWSLRDLGLRLRGTKNEFGLILVLWLAFLPVLWFVSDLPEFAKTYPQVRSSQTDMTIFIAHHAYYFVYWMGWEFFYRGLLLFGFARDYGSKAVLLSTFPFVVMHYGKPPIEMMAAIVAGFILCGIALRSRSILPGVVLHWLVQMSMDFANCTWWR